MDQAVTLQLLPAERKKGDKLVYALEAEPILAERERKEEDVHTLLELAQGYAAFWNAEAILSGLTYDGGFPSRLEVVQKSPQSCIWISGDTYPSRGQRLAWGFVWSDKKQAWYCGGKLNSSGPNSGLGRTTLTSNPSKTQSLCNRETGRVG